MQGRSIMVYLTTNRYLKTCTFLINSVRANFFSAIVYVVTEDLDDLRMEGVTTLVPSGSKFNQARASHPAEPQAKVTLNICSRCAR